MSAAVTSSTCLFGLERIQQLDILPQVCMRGAGGRVRSLPSQTGYIKDFGNLSRWVLSVWQGLPLLRG